MRCKAQVDGILGITLALYPGRVLCAVQVIVGVCLPVHGRDVPLAIVPVEMPYITTRGEPLGPDVEDAVIHIGCREEIAVRAAVIVRIIRTRL